MTNSLHPTRQHLPPLSDADRRFDFENIFEQAAVAIALVSPDGRWLRVNSKLSAVLGYTPSELLAMTFQDITHPDDLATDLDLVRRMLAREITTYTMEKRYRRKDGSVLWANLSVALVCKNNGTPDYFISEIEDISLRKAAETALRESQNRLQLLIDHAPAAMALFDRDMCYLAASRRWCEDFGIKETPLLGRCHYTVFPNLPEKWKTAHRRGLAGEVVGAEADPFIFGDGRVTWHRWQVRPWCDDAGAIGGIVIFLEDITARKEAEDALRQAQSKALEEQRLARLAALNLMEDAQMAREALQESETKYRLLAKNALDEIFWLNPEGSCQYISPACQNISGYAPAEFLQDATLMQRIVDPADREIFVTHLSNIHLKDRAELNYRIRRKDGTLAWIAHRCQPIYDQAGTYLGRHGVNRDISERVRTEQEREALSAQLSQAQKLESIGRLAGGIAHDFNNLLGVILGYVDLMEMDDVLDERQKKQLGHIQATGERARALTQQLLMFSRKQVVQPKLLNWNSQIESSLKIYRRIIGEDIAILFRPAAHLPCILADDQQLDQVLANLLINARDAIRTVDGNEREGCVTISTSLVTLTAGQEQPQMLPPGNYARLAVHDTGAGMDQATQEKIFEPFFTTKSEGKGTGLGLATVFGVVTQNHGSITVNSHPGQGTKFCILWPVPEQQDSALSEDQATTPPKLTGSEKLLLVEDADALRRLYQHALIRFGYQVQAAASAEEAERLLAETGLLPDLLLTDVVLPGMNGRVLAERLRQRWPELPVLFISGYTADVLAEENLQLSEVELLHKPFSISELSRHIRQLLNR